MQTRNMSEYFSPSTVSVPARPQPTHTSIIFSKTQNRHAQHPVNPFPWESSLLKMMSQRYGYVVGSDWAMTTLDDRADNQIFDLERLQTIDEGAEVRFFYPRDTLECSNGRENFDILQEIRHIDLHKRDSFARRLFIAAKRALTEVELKARNFCRRLLGWCL